MCDFTVKATGAQCERSTDFWVMTTRIGKSTCGCDYRPSTLACASHLSQAIARIATLNDHMAHGMSDPKRDGVTVKTRHVNTKTGQDYWA